MEIAVPPRACPTCSSLRGVVYAENDRMTYHRCCRCHVIYRSSQVMDEAYDKDYFKNHAHDSIETGVTVNQWTRLSLARGLGRGESLLDVGMARGGSMQAARDLGWTEIHGIDCTDTFLRKLEARQFHVRVADAHALPYPAERFDAVLMSHVLEHLDSPPRALSEVHRVLKPDGVAVITVPNADYWRAHLHRGRYKWYRLDREGRFHHAYFTLRTLADALEEAGLEPLTYPTIRLAGRSVREAARGQSLSSWQLLTSRLADPLGMGREIAIISRKPRAAAIAHAA